MKLLNTSGVGMHPLNHAAKLAKLAVDITHSVAVNDDMSALSRIEAARKVLDDLSAAIESAPDIMDRT